MRLYKKSLKDESENIFWMTMTDLMTGLVLVFVVMFLYSFLQNNVDNFQINAAKEQSSKVLQETLKSQNIEATVDSAAGVVKISDLELFEVNKSDLSLKGRKYLDKFVPAYIDSLFKNEYLKDRIDKILIQGHTDSQNFAGKYTQDEQYMKNMELSLNRAYSVANYMIKTPYNKSYGDKLRKIVIVEGASSSMPVVVNGKEDFAKSRRVELKLVLKNKKNNS